jgi:hypothetical protein
MTRGTNSWRISVNIFVGLYNGLYILSAFQTAACSLALQLLDDGYWKSKGRARNGSGGEITWVLLPPFMSCAGGGALNRPFDSALIDHTDYATFKLDRT